MIWETISDMRDFRQTSEKGNQTCKKLSTKKPKPTYPYTNIYLPAVMDVWAQGRIPRDPRTEYMRSTTNQENWIFLSKPPCRKPQISSHVSNLHLNSSNDSWEAMANFSISFKSLSFGLEPEAYVSKSAMDLH